MIIAIDFDGTIVRDEYPRIGPPLPGAFESIRKLKRNGHKIIIWTCRYGKFLDEMIIFLKSNNVPFDTVNEHILEYKLLFGSDMRKVYADLYIDDRNVMPWSWEDVLRRVDCT